MHSHTAGGFARAEEIRNEFSVQVDNLHFVVNAQTCKRIVDVRYSPQRVERSGFDLVLKRGFSPIAVFSGRDKRIVAVDRVDEGFGIHLDVFVIFVDDFLCEFFKRISFERIAAVEVENALFHDPVIAFCGRIVYDRPYRTAVAFGISVTIRVDKYARCGAVKKALIFGAGEYSAVIVFVRKALAEHIDDDHAVEIHFDTGRSRKLPNLAVSHKAAAVAVLAADAVRCFHLCAAFGHLIGRKRHKSSPDFHCGDFTRCILIGERHTAQSVVFGAEARVEHRAELHVAGRTARCDDNGFVRFDVQCFFGACDIAVGHKACKRGAFARKNVGRIVSLHAEHFSRLTVFAVDFVHVIVQKEFRTFFANRFFKRAGDRNACSRRAGVFVFPFAAVGVRHASDAVRIRSAVAIVVANHRFDFQYFNAVL